MTAALPVSPACRRLGTVIARGAHGAPDGARPRLRKPQRARQRLTDPLGKGTKLLKTSTGGTIFCKIPLHKIVPGVSETASWRATSRNKIMQTNAKSNGHGLRTAR